MAWSKTFEKLVVELRPRTLMVLELDVLQHVIFEARQRVAMSTKLLHQMLPTAHSMGRIIDGKIRQHPQLQSYEVHYLKGTSTCRDIRALLEK
jgi:hypothetical protein